jgi:hypothetical protein
MSGRHLAAIITAGVFFEWEKRRIFSTWSEIKGKYQLNVNKKLSAYRLVKSDCLLLDLAASMASGLFLNGKVMNNS